MVAVVSGSGLGLFGSSVSALGGIGASGNGTVGRGSERVYVNSATGNLIVQSRDEALAALGLDVALVRTYNSQGLMNDDNADNWRLGVHQRLSGWSGAPNSVGSSVVKTFGDGREVVYEYDDELDVYVSSEGGGAHDTITYDDGDWIWTDGSSLVSETYDAAGRLIDSTDADGNVVTYIYGDGLLRQILESSGQQIFLDYVGTDLAAIRVVSNGQTQTLTRYYYDSSHRLRQVVLDLTPVDNATSLVDSNGDGLFETVDDQTYVTTYTYDGQSKRIASISQSDGTYISFTYEQVGGSYRVKTYSTSPTGASVVDANTGALTTTEPVTTTTDYNLNTGVVSPAGWSTSGLPPIASEVKYDAAGNGFVAGAMYNGTAYELRIARFDVLSQTWSTPAVMGSAYTIYGVSLAVDENGNALVAWMQGDHIAPYTANLCVRQYNGATQAWGAMQVLDTSADGNQTFWSGVQIQAILKGSHAAIAYVFEKDEGDGDDLTRQRFIRYDSGVWGAPQELANDYQAQSAPNAELADQRIGMDAAGNVVRVWARYNYNTLLIYSSRLLAGSNTWSTPQLLDSFEATVNVQLTGLVMDDAGNAALMWVHQVWQGSTVQRWELRAGTYNLNTDAWSTQTIESLAGFQNGVDRLAMDADGAVLAAYRVADQVYAITLDPVTHLWSSPTLVGTGANSTTFVTVAINGNRRAIIWASATQAMVARYQDGAWVTPYAISASSGSYFTGRLTIDNDGNILASGGSTYVSYRAESSYIIPSGATWQSLAQTLYGVNTAAAAGALQAQLGNPPLTAGARLRNLPATLSVQTTVQNPVTPYYTVVTGDTWASVTQAIYGTAQPAAITALQSALNYPTLTAGTRLYVPVSLSFLSTGRLTTLTYSSGGVTADESVLSTTETQTNNVNYSLDPALQGWSPAELLEDGALHASSPQIAFDAQGNGFAIWAQWSDVYVRRYTAATDTWGPQIALDSYSDEVFSPVLSLDHTTGNAIVAWVQSDGTTNRLAMSRFTASGGTWSTAADVTTWSGSGIESTQVAVDVAGSHAVIAWAQDNGTTRDLYQKVFGASTSSGPTVIESSSEPVDQLKTQIDANGNAMTVWRQFDGGAERIYFNRWAAATQTYSGQALLDNFLDGGSWPSLELDAQGNGVAIWGQWNGLQMRRFNATTGTWGAISTVQAISDDYRHWKLALDANGNALAAWAEGSEPGTTLRARRYDAATDSWSSVATLGSVSDEISASISGSNAVVSWLQLRADESGNDVYAARFSNGSWHAPELLETRTEQPNSLNTAVDDDGNISVVWWQGDGIAKSIYEARFDGNSGAPSYTVPSGATWQSIANTLYGVNSVAAGDALRIALGNPTLTTGAQLTNLPSTLTVSTTQIVTVPPYYTVQAGATWATIAQAIYHTSDAGTIQQLQDALGNPTLIAGMHLTVPLLLGSFQTDVEDALGNVTTYVRDGQDRLVGILSPTVDGSRQETRYEYDSDGNVTAVIEDPSGLNRRTAFEYDEHGNLTTTRDAVGNTVTRTYNANNQLLTETRYQVRDPDGAGSGQPSDPLTTRYVYDGESHLRFTISAEGRVTEHAYNTSGLRRTTLTYLNAFYASANFDESDLATWAAAQGARERVDYEYDFRGNVQTVRAWPSTDSTGVATGTASVTRFVYDQRGQLLQTIAARGELTSDPADHVTTFTYDGLGRLLTTTQWVASGEIRTTVNDYDDAANRTETTIQNGANTLVTTSLYNSVGELTSVAATTNLGAQLGTTLYAYDAAGRLRIVTDPVGVRTFNIYDAAGRMVGQVDGDGTLTEYVYSSAGQLVKTVQYADRLSAGTIASLMTTEGNPADVSIDDLHDSLASVPGRNPAQDRITRAVFNAAGQLVYTIDDIGAVVGFSYDGAGRQIETVQYANFISIERSVVEVDADDVQIAADPSHDRRIRNFYDDDGNLRGTLDGAGYLVELRYDVAGRLVEQISYATATNQALRLAGSLDDLRPALDDTSVPESPETDIRSRFFYDGRGRRVGVLDGKGYLTETVYGTGADNMDLVAQVVRYNRELTSQTGDTLADLKMDLLETDKRSRTIYEYNGVGEVTKETVRLGTDSSYSSTATVYAYDAAGNMLSTSRAHDTADERTIRVRYDALGRVTQELTAEGSARIADGMSVEAAWAQYSVSHEYDKAGRRISTADQYGERTLYYYDDDGRLAYAVGAEGEVQRSSYDARGRLTDTITYDGRIDTSGLTGGRITTQLTSRIVSNTGRDSRTAVAYEYLEGGELTTSTTAEGVIARQWTDVFGDVVIREEVRAAGAGLQTFNYDQRGLLTETHGDPNDIDRIQVFEHDAFGRVVAIIDQYGNTAKTEYDALGRVVATVDPTNARRVIAYDAFSRQLTVTGPRQGSVVSYSYNDATRSMVMTSAEETATSEGVIVTTTFNAHGDTVKVVTTDGTRTNEVSYSYDANGQLRRVFDPLGNVAVNEYDRVGRLWHAIDGNGSTTEYQYDGVGRVLTKIENVGGLNLTTQYAYYDLAEGRLLRTTQPNGIVTEARYDRDGRLSTMTVNPNGADQSVTRYEYDDVNNTTTVTEGEGTPEARVTRYEFDGLGRRITELVDPGAGTNPATNRPYLNLTTRYRYDDNGNLTRKIDAENNSTWYVYDDAGRLSFTIDACGGITETTYDFDGRIDGVRRLAASTAAVANWTNINRVTTDDFSVSRDDSVDRYEQTLYDRDGRAKFTVDAMGGVTHRTFDASGNVIREVFYYTSIGVATYADADAVETALENLGVNLTTPGAADRVRWTTYDVRGRAVFNVDGLGGVTKNEYDSADNVTRVIAYSQTFSGDPLSATALDSFASTNAADTRNRITRMWYDGASRLRFTLDPENWLRETRYLEATREQVQIEYAVRTGTSSSTVAQNANYSDLVALTGPSTTLGGSIYNLRTTTHYDAAGRIDRVTDAAGHFQQFEYDAVGNKTAFINEKGDRWDYVYDANGRLLEEHSPPVEITTVGDSGGGIDAQMPVTGRIITRMEYDKLGNVIKRREGIVFANGGEHLDGSRLTKYDYDKLGRQIRTWFPEVGVYSYATGTAPVRDDLHTETTYDALGNATRFLDISGRYSYKSYDRLGRITFELDTNIGTTGAPQHYVTKRDYDAFGNVTSLTRYAQSIAPPAFTGNRLDAAQLSGAVTAIQGNEENRTIQTTYDRLNRVRYVRQPDVYVYDTEQNLGYTSAPITYFEYNAFGDVIRESKLVQGNLVDENNPDPTVANAWAQTYRYYDRRGNKIAEVDPQRFLSTYKYDDASGDVTERNEYATPLAATPSVNTVPTPIHVQTAPDNVMEPSTGHDRRWTYMYDQMNRLTSETAYDVIYAVLDDLTLVYDYTNLTTLYGYDALGNRTSVQSTDNSSAVTYTYYDKLGRVIGIAEPERDLGDGTDHTPFTRLYRDVYGNLVKQVQFATSASSVSASTLPNVSATGNDRVTLFKLDKYGRAVTTKDASGVLRYAAYTERGDVASEWQWVTSISAQNGLLITEQLSTTYYYDALGRQTRVVEPQSVTKTRTSEADYNAFGEITAKRVLGMEGAEYYKYDSAGRVWNSNSGDGVDKINLFDLAGNVTAQLKHRTLDLSSYARMSDVPLSNAALIRTEMAYDRLGRLTQQRDARHEVAGSASTATATRSQQSDRWGNVISMTDTAGNTTDYRYDKSNRLLIVKQPEVEVLSTNGGTIEYANARPTSFNFYDLSGHLLATRDARGNQNRIEYNAAGQKLREINADEGEFSNIGQTSRKTYVYDSFGQLIVLRDEGGFETRYRYDQVGQLTDMAKEISSIAFDAQTGSAWFPNIDASRFDYVIYTYGYDAAGRRISETTGEYMDGVGNTQRETKRYWYDWQGNLILVREPRGSIIVDTPEGGEYQLRFETSYEYDVDGNKIREVDGNGTVGTWQYDHFKRLHTHQQMTNTSTGYEYSSDLYGGVGDTITYNYDLAGLLTSQTSLFGQNTSYTYDVGGHLKHITERGTDYGWAEQPHGSDPGTRLLFAVTRDTEYEYDAYGRRTRERLVVDGLEHEDARVTYDALNRLRTVTDLRNSVQYSYDAAGNRTHIQATYLNAVSTLTPQDLWYVYDSMNRVTVSQGARVDVLFDYIEINQSQGVELQYNSRGYRSEMRTYGTRVKEQEYSWIDPETGLESWGFTYDVIDGYNKEIYYYDGLGRLNGTDRMRDRYLLADGGAASQSQHTDELRYYDRASRLTEEKTYLVDANSNLEEWRRSLSSYDDNGRVTRQLSYLFNGWTNQYDRLESAVMYGDAAYTDGYTFEVQLPDGQIITGGWPSGWSSGFDGAGVLRGYVVQVYNTNTNQVAYTTTHTFDYRLGETYQEVHHQAQSAGSNPNGTPLPGSTTRQYNVNGELVAFKDDQSSMNDAANNRLFANNAAGQVVSAIAGYYDYSPSYSAMLFGTVLDSTGPTIGYQFNRYWNGQLLGTFGSLQEGTFAANFDVNYTPISDRYPSTTPAQVTVQVGDTLRSIALRLFGDGSLWYVIADANGLQVGPDTELVDQVGWSLRVPNEVVSMSNTDSSFKPFDISDALGDTSPMQPMPPPPQPKKKGCGIVGQILMIVVAIVVTWATWGAATSAIGSSLGALSNFAAGAIAGAAGSIASQAVGIATGVQEEFNWTSVAAAALTGGILKGTPLGNVTQGGTSFGQMALQGAVNSSVSQGVSIALGLQDSFSWREVAISAVSTAVAGEVSERVGGSVDSVGFKGAVATIDSQLVAGTTSALVRRVMGGRMDTEAVIADVFGNALGNSIVDGMRGPVRATTGPGARNAGTTSGEIPLSGASGAAGTSTPLSNNPISQSGVALTPDEQRDLNVLQTIVVEDSRINAGEDVGLDLFYYQYQRYGSMTKEQQQAFTELGDLANQRYIARQVGFPTRTTNQAIADAFQASGGPKEFGALNALEYEALRSYGAGNGPNVVSGTLMGWMDAVNSGASKVHDFGTWLRGFDNTAGKIGAGIVALDSGVTDVLARGINGALGLGVALTDTDTQLMMLRGVDFVADNPGRVAGDMWDSYLNSDFRDRGLAGIETLAGLGVGSMATRMGRLAPELDMAGTSPSGRQISNIHATTADEANAAFIRRGWNPPYEAGSRPRVFETQAELDFVRVHGLENQPGAFLVRADEIGGMTSQEIQQHLALKYTPAYVSDVRVPSGTQMRVGRVGAQPEWGVPNQGGIQYQLLQDIPSESFFNMRPLR